MFDEEYTEPLAQPNNYLEQYQADYESDDNNSVEDVQPVA